MKKRLLFVQVSKDQSGYFENAISAVCAFLDVEYVRYVFSDLGSFYNDFNSVQPFDFVYWAAHGNEDVFSDVPEPVAGTNVFERWNRLGYYLCVAGVLTYGGVFFLGCCQGGLRKIAVELFYNCTQLRFVCGPKHAIVGNDLALALHTFLHHAILTAPDYSNAASRAAEATGRHIPFYDRYDLQTELDMKLLLSLHCLEDEVAYEIGGDDPYDDQEVKSLGLPQGKFESKCERVDLADQSDAES